MHLFNTLVYRGEGNNTIVLADPTTRQVYRFNKASEESVKCCKIKKTPSHQKVLSDTSKFGRSIMRQLLGYELTLDMNLIEVSVDSLLVLNERLKPLRPAYRLHKGIDIHCSQILQTSDATLLPLDADPFTQGDTLSVEIKPKFGCIPQFKGIPEERLRICRFCMLQFHDSKKRWSTRSEYCPCDLFSGDKDRMKSALHALLRTPQINFRIFKNGEPVFTCYQDNLDATLSTFFRGVDESQFGVDVTMHPLRSVLVELLVTALLHPQPEFGRHKENNNELSTCRQEPTTNPPQPRTPFSQHCAIGSKRVPSSSTAPLPENSVLNRILQVETLATADITQLGEHYRRVSHFLEENQLTWDWERVPDWLKATNEHMHMSNEVLESVRMISDILISMVARDCSLIVAFQRARPGISVDTAPLPNVELPNGGMSNNKMAFLYRSCVIDLDPKPLQKVEHNHILENEILDTFRQSHSAQTERENV